MKIGFLLHVYHLETTDWEEMVWGNPNQNLLGTGTKLIECLLDTHITDEVVSIVYSGPSTKDGLTEGAYTKQFILDRLAKLHEFPRLKRRLDVLSPDAYEVFLARVHGLVTGEVIKNTAAELAEGTKFFAEVKVDRVTQIAAATHAPRCLRDQVTARFNGWIPVEQQWQVVASDINYHGVSPYDVVIAEPIHRKDNPLYEYTPSWVSVTKQYPHLSLDNKKKVLPKLNEIMQNALADQPDNTEVAN